MKCDELKEVEYPIEWGLYYDKEDVDEAIAELKQKLDKAIAERDGNQVCIDALKAKLEDANERVNKSHDTIARGIKASSTRERRLRKALWLARARRAEVFAALFNNAKPQGLGKLHYQQRTMKADEASMILSTNSSDYVDYYEGRVLKVSLPPDAKEFDARLYDRDNGSGAALAAVDAVRARAEGRCCGVFVPERFLGAKREKLNIVGIPGWRFRVLGGELFIVSRRWVDNLELLAEFEFALLNRQAKVVVSIEGGHMLGRGVRNYDEFAHYATMVIHKCINELASNQNCPKTYWQVQPHFIEDDIPIVDDFVSCGISHDNG